SAISLCPARDIPLRFTLFPYTTLFRSDQRPAGLEQLVDGLQAVPGPGLHAFEEGVIDADADVHLPRLVLRLSLLERQLVGGHDGDRKSTRLNSSHQIISYAVFCLKKKK